MPVCIFLKEVERQKIAQFSHSLETKRCQIFSRGTMFPVIFLSIRNDSFENLLKICQILFEKWEVN